MRIEVIHPSFKTILDPASDIELISDGHKFTEGPVWDKENQRLLFSDIPADTIYSWNENAGSEILIKPSRYSNALAFDSDGNLIICEHQGRAISLRDDEGNRKVLADSFRNYKLNSPNDLVIANDGSILFTDPIYGLREGNGGPAVQELPFQGVYRYDSKKGSLYLITDSFERPNGLTFSPDERKLFITDTVKQHIRVFTIEKNWHLSGGMVWAELWDDDYGGRPDGLKCDQHGNLFCTGPGGIWVLSPNAQLLGRIYLSDKTSNLAWGDQDRKSLFITSSDKVFRLRCLSAGIG